MSIVQCIERIRFDAGIEEAWFLRTLTNAEIKALPTTGLEVVPAPGSGKRLFPLLFNLELDATAGLYTNINAESFLGFNLGPIDVLSYVGNNANFQYYERQAGLTGARVGGTAGWVLETGTNLPYIARLAAGNTASTLVLPIPNLLVGDTITGFRVVAQIESGGNTCTLDGILRATTNVAAEPTDAAIGTGMTQVSVTADTAVSQVKSGLTEVVASGKTYYLLLTATTGGSTDIILQACEIHTRYSSLILLNQFLAYADVNSAWGGLLLQPDDAPNNQWLSLAKVHEGVSTLTDEALGLYANNGGSGDFTGGHTNNTLKVYTKMAIIL